ncbi:MAG: glycosyltransferase family 87 protein [Elusimicrobiota bacterium]
MNQPRRAGLIALSLLALASIFLVYRPLRYEDFVYYYCAGRSAATGRSPYEVEPYQACIAEVLGRPNLNVSKDTGSVYPPPAIALFRAFAALPYSAAFALWNAALLSASAALLWETSADPAAWLLLLSWPAFISCWAYHKMSIPLLLSFLIGMRLVDRGRHRLGGGLLCVLCVQPQWLGAAALSLAAQKRWRALGSLAAASLLIFAAAPHAWLDQWVSSAAFHSENVIGFDNQSLFLSLYRPMRTLFVVDLRWFQIARYGASLALGLLAWRCAAKKNSESLGLFLGLVLLAQPYSHVSDGVWIFPLYLNALARFQDRLRWTRPQTVAAGLLFNAAAVISAGGFLPGRMHRPDDVFRQGYLACAVAALYALSRLRETSDAARSLTSSGPGPTLRA